VHTAHNVTTAACQAPVPIGSHTSLQVLDLSKYLYSMLHDSYGCSIASGAFHPPQERRCMPCLACQSDRPTAHCVARDATKPRRPMTQAVQRRS